MPVGSRIEDDQAVRPLLGKRSAIDGFKIIDADEGIHIACDQSTWGDRENVVLKNNYIDTTEGNPDVGIAATGIVFYSLYDGAGDGI